MQKHTVFADSILRTAILLLLQAGIHKIAVTLWFRLEWVGEKSWHCCRFSWQRQTRLFLSADCLMFSKQKIRFFWKKEHCYMERNPESWWDLLWVLVCQCSFAKLEGVSFSPMSLGKNDCRTISLEWMILKVKWIDLVPVWPEQTQNAITFTRNPTEKNLAWLAFTCMVISTLCMNLSFLTVKKRQNVFSFLKLSLREEFWTKHPTRQKTHFLHFSKQKKTQQQINSWQHICADSDCWRTGLPQRMMQSAGKARSQTRPSMVNSSNLRSDWTCTIGHHLSRVLLPVSFYRPFSAF